MAINQYHLADVVAEYMRDACGEIIEELRGFLLQFSVIIEVEEDDDDQEIDFKAIEDFLKEETNGIDEQE